VLAPKKPRILRQSGVRERAGWGACWLGSVLAGERAGYPLEIERVRPPLLIALLDQLRDPRGRKIMPA